MMKRYFAAIILGMLCFVPRAYASYSYYRLLTASTTLIGLATSTASLPNYPALFSLPSGTLWSETTSTNASGRFQNLFGFDHSYSTSTSCSFFLNYDSENYVSSTGELEDWVKIPILSSSSNQIYICYGDPTISTIQAHPSSTYDSNFIDVWHLNEATGTNATDTILNNNLTKSTAVKPKFISNGIVDGAERFASATIDFMNKTASVTNVPAANATQTVSIWFNLEATSTTKDSIVLETAGAGSAVAMGWRSNNAKLDWFSGGGTVLVSTSTPTLNAWHNTTYVLSGTLNTMYLDGLVVATTSGGQNVNVPTIIYISTFSGASENWVGNLDEVRVSNINRSPDWNMTDYNTVISSSTFWNIGNEVAPFVPLGEGLSVCSIYNVSIMRGTLY